MSMHRWGINYSIVQVYWAPFVLDTQEDIIYNNVKRTSFNSNGIRTNWKCPFSIVKAVSMKHYLMEPISEIRSDELVTCAKLIR